MLQAIAGAGKSEALKAIAMETGATIRHGALRLLDDGSGLLLWDAGTRQPSPAEAEVLHDWLASGPDRRAIVALRPGMRLDGLEREWLYGHAVRLGFDGLRLEAEDFCDPEVAAAALAASAGWPFLHAMLARRGNSAMALQAFLAAECLAGLAAETIVALSLLSRSNAPIAVPAFGEAVEQDLAGLEPLVVRDAGGWRVGPPMLRQPLLAALAPTLAALGATNVARIEASALQRAGRTTDAILALQRAGDHAAALEAFTAAHGYNLIYFQGYAAFDAVLAGFPEAFAKQSDALVFALALQALKSGNVQRARLLLTERFGPDAHNLGKVFANPSQFSLAFRCFRLVVTIYDELTLSDRTLEAVFSLLAELPVDDHQRRGTFYNSVLEIYTRRRRYAEAEGIAERALVSYRAIGADLLVFYIHIFQAALSLMQGDVRQARRHAGEAGTAIERLEFDSPADRRILALVEGCIAYEDGDIQPLVLFLSGDLDRFAMGEIWPSLIEFAIHYGSQTLSRHLSTFSARSFLERWRIQQWRSRRFRMAIELQEAVILQNGNRWLEAAETLSALQSRINRTWVEAAGEQLARIADPEELALAISWLRHFVHEVPQRRELPGQINALLLNDAVTRRQKIALMVWAAHVARRQRDLSTARATLLKAYEEAARLACIAPLLEEMLFLHELAADQRIAEFLRASPLARQVTRRLDALEMPTTTASAEAAGLSRRELRVLLLVAEGSSNKLVARHLGISEATVKFHLANLYRKLGCSSRREAIATARSLRLIA